MFTVIGFQESLAGSTAYKNLAAVADEHVRISGDYIYIPELNNIVGKVVCGGSIADEGYLASPSLRAFALLDIGQIIAAVNPTSENPNVYNPSTPIPLVTDEGLELLLKETTTTSQIRTAAVWLSDGALSPVIGEIHTVQATATITSVVGSWVNGAITFRQTLPAGKYQLVGARCKCATGVAFRFVFVGGIWRPGGLCTTAIQYNDPAYQRFGGLGVWGEFEHFTPPTVEIIAGTAAAQSPELYLDLIKIA